MLEVRSLELPEVLEIRTARHCDDRGYFSEVWNKAAWAQAGVTIDVVQDNHSLSVPRGVVRGLHYQLPPFAQDKIVRVTRGSIFDVAVDVRRSSSTFGRWVGRVLSAREWNQLLVPKGFAHGFLTLEPETEVQYKVSAPYSASSERTVRFNDPTLSISWPDVGVPLKLSAKDEAAPLLCEAEVFA